MEAPLFARNFIGSLFLDLRTDAGVIRMGTGPAGSITGFEVVSVVGRIASDEIHPGAGNDVISGGPTVPAFYDPVLRQTDILDGGAGDDLIRSAEMAQDDLTDTAFLRDRLIGGAGHDTLIGGNGNAKLCGGSGHDVLHGGLGAGTMAGGTGADRFVSDLGDSGMGVGQIDNINYFVSHIANFPHHDLIDLTAIYDHLSTEAR